MSLPILPSQAKPTSGPLPTITNANISLPYASGGGGGSGPSLAVSSLNVNSSGGVELRYGAGATQAQSSAEVNFDHDSVPSVTTSLVYDPTDGVSSLSVYWKANNFFPGTLNVAELKGVSTINGAAPGGGGLFQSTFNAVPCPQNASTILLAMPSGQFGYNGLLTGTSATGYLSGFLNTVSNSAGPFYFGQIIEAPSGQPPNALPCQMVINTGDSGLSTIKLIVANTSSQPATFTGVVSKLY